MASEWVERRLVDLTDNFDGIRVPVKEADRRPGPYPYYGASGVVDHVDSYLFDGEYLLIAEDGENLRTRSTPVAFLARGKFWVNNHAHIVRGNSEADTRFLMYALSAADISGYLTGSTMPKLTQGSMNRIPLLTPPLDDQRAIAHILGALDDKIELNRQMNRTLEGMAQALFKSWFVDFDPVAAKAAGRQPWGVNADTAALFPNGFEDSPGGPIPRGWRFAAIGDEVRVVGGSTPRTNEPRYWEGGTIHWATPKDLSALADPVLLGTERRITREGLDQISSGLLPAGAVLLSSRAPIGYLAIAGVPTAVNQGFIGMVCTARLPNYYVLQWARETMDEITSRAGGTTFAEISRSNFRPIPVLVPNETVLRAYVGLVGVPYGTIIENVRQSRTLSALRDVLLPRLLSGEIRVREGEKLVERAGACDMPLPRHCDRDVLQ